MNYKYCNNKDQDLVYDGTYGRCLPKSMVKDKTKRLSKERIIEISKNLLVFWW